MSKNTDESVELETLIVMNVMIAVVYRSYGGGFSL